MHCLRKGDVFPDTDAGLLNGLIEVTKLDHKPNTDYLMQLKQRWGCWCVVMLHFIFGVHCTKK